MYTVLKCLVRFFLLFVFRIELAGVENVPIAGPVVFSPNHRSNWDPVLLFALATRDLRFMAKKELFDTKPGAWLFGKIGVIPVDREKNDIRAVKLALRDLSNGEAVCIFPGGTRIIDEENAKIKSGVVVIASHGNAPIVPTYIKGKFRWFSKIKISFGEPITFKSKKMSSEQLENETDSLWTKMKQLGE